MSSTYGQVYHNSTGWVTRHLVGDMLEARSKDEPVSDIDATMIRIAELADKHGIAFHVASDIFRAGLREAAGVTL